MRGPTCAPAGRCPTVRHATDGRDSCLDKGKRPRSLSCSCRRQVTSLGIGWQDDSAGAPRISRSGFSCSPWRLTSRQIRRRGPWSNHGRTPRAVRAPGHLRVIRVSGSSARVQGIPVGGSGRAEATSQRHALGGFAYDTHAEPSQRTLRTAFREASEPCGSHAQIAIVAEAQHGLQKLEMVRHREIARDLGQHSPRQPTASPGVLGAGGASRWPARARREPLRRRD